MDKKNKEEGPFSSLEEKRKIDEVATQTYSWLGRTYIFIKKTKVKTWRGVFIVAFAAGIAAATVSMVSFNIQMMSEAATEVGLSLLNSQTGEDSVSVIVGDSFGLDVIMDTLNNNVVVARAIIEYDPTFFELTGWDTSESVFDNSLDCSDAENPDRTCEIINNDTENGVFDITLSTPTPGVNVDGGMMANINFNALQSFSGSKEISLRFISSGNYEDSDVIADDGNGTDILQSVNNAIITVDPLDQTAPVLTEITPVASPTSDTTPNYVFSSTEAGLITYGGSCSSDDAVAVLGNNTITFSSLAEGTYTDCTIAVTDASGNISDSLAVTSFAIESAAIVLERGDVDQNGTINTTDAQLVLRKSVGMDMSQTSWYDSANTGDANCDDATNTTDAMLILRNSVGSDMSATDWCL